MRRSKKPRRAESSLDRTTEEGREMIPWPSRPKQPEKPRARTASASQTADPRTIHLDDAEATNSSPNQFPSITYRHNSLARNRRADCVMELAYRLAVDEAPTSAKSATESSPSSLP